MSANTADEPADAAQWPIKNLPIDAMPGLAIPWTTYRIAMGAPRRGMIASTFISWLRETCKQVGFPASLPMVWELETNNLD
jgi:hypothetical protein